MTRTPNLATAAGWQLLRVIIICLQVLVLREELLLLQCDVAQVKQVLIALALDFCCEIQFLIKKGEGPHYGI
jgi:hypothetical protein